MKMKSGIGRISLLAVAILLCVSCSESQVPKPRGHFRIDLPEKEYLSYDSICPFDFEYPVYGIIESVPGAANECWFNIAFPEYRAKIHLSYQPVSGNLGLLTDDAHRLAYKHSIKADAIEEKIWINEDFNVFGTIYDIEGNAASSAQFFVTDSLNHYLRGSLYFNASPNKDSLAPVIDFFREDIIHLVETLKWK
jgi:gliding motility-associated lipoprotein GldD